MAWQREGDGSAQINGYTEKCFSKGMREPSLQGENCREEGDSFRVEKNEAGCKPNSVPRVRGHGHFTVDAGCPASLATYPETMSGQPLNVSLFGLAPNGVCRALNVTIQAVSSYLAVSPLPGIVPGGLFSVALSPGHPAFALRTILPCGVRTFLSGMMPERPCARFSSYHSPGAGKLEGESRRA